MILFKPILFRFLLAVMAFTLAACSSEEEVYTNLNVREVNEMVAVLRNAGVEAKREAGIGDNNFTLLVPAEDFSLAVQVLSVNGYPKEEHPKLTEIFPGDGLIVSPLEQKARLAYALNEELARTITYIDGVIRARVHVVVPDNTSRVGNQQRASASVSVHHRVDVDPAELSSKIRLIVSNAVPDLDYRNVSISFFAVDRFGAPVRKEGIDVGGRQYVVDPTGVGEHVDNRDLKYDPRVAGQSVTPSKGAMPEQVMSEGAQDGAGLEDTQKRLQEIEDDVKKDTWATTLRSLAMLLGVGAVLWIVLRRRMQTSGEGAGLAGLSGIGGLLPPVGSPPSGFPPPGAGGRSPQGGAAPPGRGRVPGQFSGQQPPSGGSQPLQGSASPQQGQQGDAPSGAAGVPMPSPSQRRPRLAPRPGATGGRGGGTAQAPSQPPSEPQPQGAEE